MQKYITYDTLPSGFNNVWITLEMMLALAAVTERKILLGDVFHYGSQTRFYRDYDIIPISEYMSMWEVLDKTAIIKNFDVEFLDIKHLHKNCPHYKNNFLNCHWISIPHKFPFDEDGLTPYLVSQKSIRDRDDYNEFACGRTFTEIDIIDEHCEIISYGDFGQFFYNIYLGDKNKRNIIKKKINNSLVYKQQYEDLVNSLIAPNTYNSVHIRYAKLVGGILGEIDDFTGTYPVGPLKILERIEQLFEKDVPLYIAIDITQSSKEDGNSKNINVNDYLDVIRKKYTVITLEDFNLDLSYTEKLVVDQLFCVNSKTFYGAYNSTFSKRIDILRGIKGKTTYDYMGWNKIQPSYVRTDSPYPWKQTEKHIWPWYYSSYPQYMLGE